jgi:hypothetical protein
VDLSWNRSNMNRTIAIAVLCASALAAYGDDARQIVSEAQHRTQVSSEHYEGLLQVIDAKGKTTQKKWIYDRLGSHGNSKVVLRFTTPAEVKGVALLIQNHPDRSSDQWMWTPAINRDRRIAMQDRRTRFFGTDFSFEDLEERDVEQYDYASKGEETVDGEACWKIESKPRATKTSQYTSSMLWIRKSNYAYAKIEKYTDSKLIRSILYNDVRQVQGIWTPRLLEVHDLERNSRTNLKLESLEYNLPLKEADFTLQALRVE